jgi:hypothetical protein
MVNNLKKWFMQLKNWLLGKRVTLNNDWVNLKKDVDLEHNRIEQSEKMKSLRKRKAKKNLVLFKD